MPNLGAAYVSIKADLKPLGKSLNQAYKSVSSTVDRMSRRFVDFGVTAVKAFGLIASAAAAVTAYKIGKLAMGVVEVGASFETLGIQLETVLGSSAKAEQGLKWIADFAVNTPYLLDEVAEAFVKLSAYGLDATKWLKTLGDTASGMGKSLNDTVEMFVDAMTGEFERLKEFGVKAKTVGDQVTFNWTQNGKAMTVTTAKTAEGITKALGGIFSRFDGGMEKMSKSWSGMISNLKGAWTSFQKAIADAGLFNYVRIQIKYVLDEINRLKKEGTLDAWAKKISTAMVEVTRTVSMWIQQTYRDLKQLYSDGKIHQWIDDFKEGFKAVWTATKGVAEGISAVVKALKFAVEVGNEFKEFIFTMNPLIEKLVGMPKKILFEFFGKGSSEKPITEKIDEIQTEMQGLADTVTEPMKAIADFTQVHQEIDKAMTNFERLQSMATEDIDYNAPRESIGTGVNYQEMRDAGFSDPLAFVKWRNEGGGSSSTSNNYNINVTEHTQSVRDMESEITARGHRVS